MTAATIARDPDLLLPPEPRVRAIARELYECIRGLPIVSLHGHVDAALLAEDHQFHSATTLLITDDHYITRLLVSQGVPLDAFDWRRPTAVEPLSDRDVWRTFCQYWPAFRGTPTRTWLEHELVEVLGIDREPSEETADLLFDEIAERLADPAFRPRALFERFGIEVLATTDEPWSDLSQHAVLRDASLGGDVIPTMRPDRLFEIAAYGWRAAVGEFAHAAGTDIRVLDDMLHALVRRRAEFQAAGATATDHGTPTLRVARMPDRVADELFRRALDGERIDAAEAAAFRAHLLFESAQMAATDGLVMQLHPGVLRGADRRVAARHGEDRGFDIPFAIDAAHSLRPMLEAYGFAGRFRCVLYTLDETLWARELAPLAGVYPSVFLGAPWWFHDSPNAMLRFRRAVTETAGFQNTAGFVDDTRAFLSIPARHDVARRVDAAYLAELVAAGLLGRDEALEVAVDLTVGLPRRVFRRGEEGHR